jgi:hypothetical protein
VSLLSFETIMTSRYCGGWLALQVSLGRYGALRGGGDLCRGTDVGLQTVPDWVLRSNGEESARLETGKAPGKSPILATGSARRCAALSKTGRPRRCTRWFAGASSI